jgi:SnoaL-like domain
VDIAELSKDFLDLCRTGDFRAPGAKYHSPDVVSIEPEGPNPVLRGREAVHAKSVWWYETHEIHTWDVFGPFVHGDQFTARFIIDFTYTKTGDRQKIEEIAVYTVRGDEIVEERFFYEI